MLKQNLKQNHCHDRAADIGHGGSASPSGFQLTDYR